MLAVVHSIFLYIFTSYMYGYNPPKPRPHHRRHDEKQRHRPVLVRLHLQFSYTSEPDVKMKPCTQRVSNDFVQSLLSFVI